MPSLHNSFTLIGFKLTWIACILGEIYINSWFGFFIGILFLMVFFYFEKNKLRSLNIVLIFATLGYCWDSLLSYFNLYVVDATINFLFLPLWFIVLWPCLCCLFVNIFQFFQKQVILSSFIGSTIVTLTYYGGLSLGLVNVSNYLVFLLIYIFWFLLIFFYSKFSPKF